MLTILILSIVLAALFFLGAKTNALLERPWAVGREMVAVAGSFAPNGSSAVVAASNKGRGFTVARTTTGKFTITFTHKFNDLISAVGGMQLHTDADVKVVFGDYTAPTATADATLVVFTDTAGTAADVAVAANNRVNFVCWFSNTAVTP